MKTFKEMVNEVAEVPYDKVMKKIKDGEWEAEQDVVKGKLVSMSVFNQKNPKKRTKLMIRVI